jgi:hypothetical protein
MRPRFSSARRLTEGRAQRLTRLLAAWLTGLALVMAAPQALSEDAPPEYRLKAAFLYNFALFTEWPPEAGPTLNVCVFGKDPFGEEIDPLQGKKVGSRSIAVHRKTSVEQLSTCQLIFIAAPAMARLPQVLEIARGAGVLTVADSPGAADRGVALNMHVVQNRITFEANLEAARQAKVSLSAKLLRLATEVRQ